MKLVKRNFSPRWIWFGILALALGALLPPKALAAEREVGKKVISGMTVRVWLEEPKKMQMFMNGKWMTFRPKAGALTHHLGVDLSVPASGERIPYAAVSATLINGKSGKRMTKRLPAMFGKRLFYGVNLKLDRGKYELVIKVDPPKVMRMEGAMNQWTKPIGAKFALEVK